MTSDVALHSPLSFAGRVELPLFESALLRGNRAGDPHRREVPVYLPPSYDSGSPLPVVDTLFRVANVVAAPVLDGEGHLVGLVTDRDIFKHSNVDAHTAVADLGIGEDEDSWTWEGLRNVIVIGMNLTTTIAPL